MQSRWILAVLATISLCLSACATSTVIEGTGGETGVGGEPGTGGSGGSGGEGGTGGEGGSGGAGPCVGADDCIAFTDSCNIGACINGACTGFPTNEDGPCDDGAACTLTEVCKAGVCTAVTEKFCPASDSCHVGTCNVTTDTCTEMPGNDGAGCIDDDPCTLTGVCMAGACTPGMPVDCSFLDGPCSVGTCDPMVGCKVIPQNDGVPCDDGLFCTEFDECSSGFCGGQPKACAPPGFACLIGACDEPTDTCTTAPGNDGASCDDGDICTGGETCAAGACLGGMPANPGAACNDHNSCTGTDVCVAGTCAGSPVAGCDFYFEEDFETGCPPGGWTLGGDWECGMPIGPGPGAPYQGAFCIGTQIDGDYNNNQSYSTTIAQTPTIGLGTATNPILQFAAWIETESCCDGVNLKISTNGGATFSVLTSITPAYNLNIGLEPSWGGDFALNWQIFTADLTPYVGQNIILRFSMQTDSSVIFPGAYIDDITITEANAIPLAITTQSPLPGALVASPYLNQMQKTGGTPSPAWSIVGGVNSAWLTIDPVTGILSGTPLAANLGPFSVTVHVEEPTLPSNFDEKVLNGSVIQGIYGQNFEGVCPNGWTLGGDWQCGTPSGPGPGASYDGVKCLGTQIGGLYNNNQSFSFATATSPAISLSGAGSPQLTFRMWNQTEAFFDGANLKISTDGINFSQVLNVNPPYSNNSGAETVWAGDESGLGWQLVTVDLSAYAGQTIYLRIAFNSDGSVTYAGVYIDSILIAE